MTSNTMLFVACRLDAHCPTDFIPVGQDCILKLSECAPGLEPVAPGELLLLLLLFAAQAFMLPH